MAELIVLRLIHILGAIFWLGSMIFMTFFLMPAMQQAGPASGQVMAGLVKRKIMVVIPVVAILTLLSGMRLWWIASGHSFHWFEHRVGHTFGISGILALVAFLIGITVTRPGMTKVMHLNQMAASDPVSKDKIAVEVAALQRRVLMANRVIVALMMLAAAGMAIARYM